MCENVKVKVCGITRKEDAEAALDLGAEAIGINFYQPSPRFVSYDRAKELLQAIPVGKRVMVSVSPTHKELEQCLEMGFDIFQIHFPLSTPDSTIIEWGRVVGMARLWLAPRMPKGKGDIFPERLLGLAKTYLIDAPSDKLYGGTGKTGNWEAFGILQKRYPEKNWILAGGLNPENIALAVRTSETRYADINSGVESTPGIKSTEKLTTLFKNLRSS